MGKWVDDFYRRFQIRFDLLTVFFLTLNVGSLYLRIRNSSFADKVDVPVQGGYGMDLQTILEWVRRLFMAPGTYFTQTSPANVYPPAHVFFYLPYAFLSEKWAYILFSALSLFALFTGVFFSFRLRIKDTAVGVLFTMVLVALLASTYPVLFCFERGNSDLINGALCVLFLYFLLKGQKVGSLIALTIGTQMKIFPALFAVFWIYRREFKTFAQFCVLNFILLFSLGLSGLRNFLINLSNIQLHPYVWHGNHSLRSGLENYFGPSFVTYTGVLGGFLFCTFGGIFLYQMKKNPKFESERGQWIFCALLGMAYQLVGLLPATSHDYKLVIQIVPYIWILTLAQIPRSLGVLISILTAVLFLPPHYLYPKTAVLVMLFSAYAAMSVLDVDKLVYDRNSK